MSSCSTESNRFETLNYIQTKKLSEVLQDTVCIDGKGNFPSLEVRLKDLVQRVRSRLAGRSVHIDDVRLNGGVASYVVSEAFSSDTTADTQPLCYNDIDIIFKVRLCGEEELQTIKTEVLECLLEFLPESANRTRLTGCNLKDAYVNKMTKVWTEQNRWSLISLSNDRGRNVELKFVDTMKRQYEFSVDSFQIVLDGLFSFAACSSGTMTEDFYPSVVVESVYGDYRLAEYHLCHRIIATEKPEEIRGGGLLKYCLLLVRGFQADPLQAVGGNLEKYMCSRFFIDFPEVTKQYQKLDSYLSAHFTDDYDTMCRYLSCLHRVVDASTICLMGHERRMALELIDQMAYHIWVEKDRRLQEKDIEIHFFDDNNNSFVVDQVFYGPSHHLSSLTPGMQAALFPQNNLLMGPMSPPPPYTPPYTPTVR